MKRLALAVFALGLCAAAQPAAAPKSGAEEQDLERALSAAGGSSVEYLRALESHLAKYPNTPRRAELQAAAARAAIEAGDTRATIEYGERVLASRPDDLSLLEPVARALVAAGSRENWERAVRYARRAEDLLLQQRNDATRGGPASAAVEDRIDQETAGVLLTEARATGALGNAQDALTLARRAYEMWPAAESARDRARWQERLGHPMEAATALADAITVQDPRATLDERARDRAHMHELYVLAKGSSAGEGDMMLDAFDRNAALIHARELRTHAGDPNALAADPMEFNIAGVDGSKLSLATLKGKVVVLSFWATWCVPCREEHPLLQQVRKAFAANPDVVFLAIDTDEDRAAVKPFLEQARWDDRVYFDDGLAAKLSVMSLPTTIVFDRSGKVFSRTTGFGAGQFVSTLTERIQAALK
jgi:thiol-disulfide isomerase/thioredoxin